MKMKKRYKAAASAPLITAFMILTVYAVSGIFPFGSETIAWCDLDQQTIPLIMDLKDILSGNGSIFFSTANGGGMNFWGVFLFFLASPFYIFSVFVPKEDMIYFVNILFVLKLASASATAGFYFAAVHPRLSPALCTLLGVMYALCGYGLLYYQALIWLDIMYLFPLLVMSAERMCRTGKHTMYCVMLSLMMTVNYYLSYMAVIYLILTVPLYIAMVCRKEHRKRAMVSFVLSSAAAALITAPVWLCSYLQVSSSARGLDTFAQFITDSLTESITEKFCLIMCTALGIAVLPFFFRNSICRKKIVRYRLAVLMLLLIPVFIDPINKLWHTGSYQSFPMRFGYMTVFVMLSLAAHLTEFLSEKNRNPRTSRICTAAMTMFTVIYAVTAFLTLKGSRSSLSGYLKSLTISGKQFRILFMLFLASAVLYFSAVMLFRLDLLNTRGFTLAISAVFAVEFAVNSSVYIGLASNEDTVFRNTMKAEGIVNTEGLYRTKAEKKYLHANMVGALGYNSLAHYTSLTSEDYMFAMKKMGYSSYWMEVSPNGGTVLTDALLSVKYSIGTDFDFASYQTNCGENSVFTVAESSIVCPAGIISGSPPEENLSLDFTDRAAVQEQLAETMLGADNIVERYEYEVICGSAEYKDDQYYITADDDSDCCIIKYSISADRDMQLYFDLFGNISNRLEEDQYNAAEVYVNGVCINKSYPNQKSNGLLNLGEFCDESAEISVIINKDVTVSSFGVFGIDINNLADAVKNAETAEPDIDGNTITAECDADENKFLYLSVPWDKGFTAYLNGRRTELFRVNDAFSAIRLESGHNSIKMVYYPPGFRLSVLLSALGILMFTVISVRKKAYPPFINRACAALAGTAFFLVLAVVYFTAPLVYLLGKLI
ncbi:MAG: YfhO family protein [Porcipelethomonas sp.]